MAGRARDSVSRPCTCAPDKAAAEIGRIMLNPGGTRTLADINALVPTTYQAWVHERVLVR